MKNKETYFCEEAAALVRVLDFLEGSGLVHCEQRFRVIRYLMTHADENGRICTTYAKAARDMKGIELNTVGFVFRALMKHGIIRMTKNMRTEQGFKNLTEYEINRDALRELLQLYF